VASFLGFIVSVTRDWPEELREEFKHIPEASSKICERWGLPTCRPASPPLASAAAAASPGAS
jgi:hypothetical protein